MKRPILASALLAAGLFGTGIAVGQIGGIPGSSAATTVATPSATQAAPDAGGHQSGAQDTPHADGTVTAINGNTLTISAGTDPSGTTEYTGVTTVTLTSATQYDAGHDSTGTISKSSIKVGSYVIVEGTLSSDGKTITATSLGINPGGPVPGR
ncbi:MAG TPA: DUF5666 domain-containing protein [Chloroflexota bacterium]